MKEIFMLIIIIFYFFIIGVLLNKFFSYLGLKVFRFSEIFNKLINKKKSK